MPLMQYKRILGRIPQSGFLLLLIEVRKVLDRTPREHSGWNHYTIEGFSVEPLIGGSGWNLSQMVLSITLYLGFQVEPSESFPGGNFIKLRRHE